MSAEKDYGTHLHARPGAKASTEDLISWLRTKVTLLNRIANEQPHRADWARTEARHDMDYIADLRTGVDS